MYVGDSSNSPVEQMSVKKYSQTSNPNLLDNTNFFNPINQRNQTSYSNTDAAPKYSIDRWQVLGGTFDVQTRTYTSNSTLGIYGNQFRQYIPLENVSIGDTITVSSVINDTRHVFTTTIPQYGDSVTGAPFLLETTWGGFKMITREAEHAALLTMVVNVSQSITVDWIKMELGNFATPYVSKEYSVELSECLRYFQAIFMDWRTYPPLIQPLFHLDFCQIVLVTLVLLQNILKMGIVLPVSSQWKQTADTRSCAVNPAALLFV